MRLFLFLAALPLLADPLILGHRGCRALRPENTLPAFEHALAVGADVLELDVVVTRDNALVVHHDLELNRKAVRKMTLDEVRAFDRGGTPSAGFPRQTPVPGAKVPLLEEVFAFAKERKARLMVETKVDPDVKPEWFAAAVDKLIRKYGLSERILLQSFDHRTLHAMRRLNPEVGLVLLNPARRLEDYVGPAKELGPQAIQFVNFRVIDAEIVRTLHAAGIRVFSGTTDDRGAWGKLRALGVDGILTDDPEDLRGILGRVVMTERRDGVVIEDLVFRNSFQEYDTAYRVCPAGANGVAAILFVHWLEPDDSTSNRSQFLSEAVGLARRGACSLLVTAMWAGPDWFPHRDPAKDRVATERQRKRLGDALDFLLETPGIDRARVAYVGHDFGGMCGALMAASERRVGVWALQAATPRWHEWYLLGRKLDPAAREKVAAEMRDMDPVAAIGKGAGAFLFQFGTNDRFVPRARAEEFFAAAPAEKKILWYEAGHGLNGDAVRDRVAWLVERLRLR